MTEAPTVLLLAGTREARELAGLLGADPRWRVIASLAGVTSQPGELPVETRSGGFGGAAGLAFYLQDQGIRAVLDVTHPFASTMSGNAVNACRTAGVPLLRVERPRWQETERAQWINVETLHEAAAALPSGARAFLTVGSNGLEPFAGRHDVWFLIRTVEPVPGELSFPQAEMIKGLPGIRIEDELSLMTDHAISHLITKNAGGPAAAKLDAARELGIPVIVVDRPALAPAPTVSTPAEAVAWLEATLLST